MKRNARKLSALVIGLALLMSMFAVAESGGQEIIDLGGDIAIDGGVGTAGGTVTDDGPQGALEIELDAGEGLPDGGMDPAGAPDLGLDLGPGPERRGAGEQRGGACPGHRRGDAGRRCH